jgi:hypothetical protein
MIDGVGVAVRVLRTRRGEIEDAIFARVQGEAFDRLGEHDAQYMAGLRAAITAAVAYALEGIEHGEQQVGPIPVIVVEQARRAARIGVSLDTVLRRYVVGHTLLGEFVMEQADRTGLTGGRGELVGAMRAQAGVLDRLLGAITREYEMELARAARSPAQRRIQRVQGLLLDADATESVGPAELGYRLEGWHLGVIATGADAERAVRELAEGMGRRLLSVLQGDDSVWAWFGGDRRPAFADIERVIKAKVASAGVALALGEPARDLQGWRLTHQQAQAALGVALRRGGREDVTFTRYSDVALLASALKDQALAAALSELYIEPLDDPDNSGPLLRQTLRAYLATERSVSSTAAALGVVRRTVGNRLSTIEERLGRTLHPFPAELEVALLLDELGE